jgi:excisionase family DNA binding protein
MVQVKKNDYLRIVKAAIKELEDASTAVDVCPDLLVDMKHLQRQLLVAPKPGLPVRSLKIGDAAEYMGVSRRFLYDLGISGQIPRVKLSEKLICFDVDDLDRYIDERKELCYGGVK